VKQIHILSQNVPAFAIGAETGGGQLLV